MLKSDPTRFKQIISNFLSNAMKFTHEGYIELGYFINEVKVPVFYVKDTGIGIDPQVGEQIFNRFWKYEGHNNKFYSGTGLGLAICKKLSELLGGEIWFESIPNKGSTFYFKVSQFFFTKETPSESKDITSAITQPDWTAYSVVIAEDEEYNLKYLIEILKPTKINVISFTNGVDVVNYFSNNKGNKVNILLMDIKMPQMDGIEAAKIIKKIYPQLPIIAQTAYATNDDIKRIKAAAFDDYITKPIKATDLIEKIQAFI
jgi:CheY-like chemotaxis protein